MLVVQDSAAGLYPSLPKSPPRLGDAQIDAHSWSISDSFQEQDSARSPKSQSRGPSRCNCPWVLHSSILCCKDAGSKGRQARTIGVRLSGMVLGELVAIAG